MHEYLLTAALVPLHSFELLLLGLELINLDGGGLYMLDLRWVEIQRITLAMFSQAV